jgi:hypothetical protein
MIVFYLLLFIGTFLAFLLIKVYKSVFFAMAQSSVGVVNEMFSQDDEDIKLPRLQKKTTGLILALLKFLLLILVALAIGVAPVVLFNLFTNDNSTARDLSSWIDIIVISAGATVPFLIPDQKKSKSTYSDLSKLLHRMILDNYNIGKRLLNAEIKRTKKKGIKQRNDFLIISGLARAGTTSFMNELSRFESFVSLSYANMPFLLSPNLWKRIYNPKTKNLKERSHQDGIMIGYNSAEALEEYFFKVVANDEYFKADYLEEYEIPEIHYQKYLDYQDVIKLDEHTVYLAKNNNFILRYESIRQMNPDFVMVILFREPALHAASLMEKHLSYQKLQDEDPFVLEYMDWLGHHEFGLHQKQFLLGNDGLITEDKSSPDYWLQIWINYYNYALTFKHENTWFINYDDYCANPGGNISLILDKFNISKSVSGFKPFTNRRKVQLHFSQDLLNHARDIYTKLIAGKVSVS